MFGTIQSLIDFSGDVLFAFLVLLHAAWIFKLDIILGDCVTVAPNLM